jgi:hypothetical protein
LVDPNKNEPISNIQKQKWRKEYLKNRYLSHFSNSELKNRLNDILLNLLVFSENGRASFNFSSQKMIGIVERFIHIDEQMLQNGSSLASDSINDPNAYLSKYPNILRAIKAWNNRDLQMGTYLVKFGKKKHLQLTKDAGKIRIRPASSYNDPSLNEAIQDIELSQTMLLPPGTKLNKKKSSSHYKEINGIKKIALTNTYQTDFYVYCLGNLYQHRLFDDFDADACLLIYDTEMFLDKFLNCLKTKYSDWLLKSGEITYYDPCFPNTFGSIPFSKYLRFWYQSEFRIAFKPKELEKELKEFDMEMGSLSKCCELILI